ncbi:MAG TPA: hypothetical protein VF412_03835 [Bdellovibrio sp.]|uniref:hypothetical protein n=1 Tax=Bdellovibrio sp. TaxID=28201 RepID=UPI002F133105
MNNRIKMFLSFSEELSHLIENEGWAVRPYQSSTLPYFQALSDDLQDGVLKQIQDYLLICKKTMAEGYPIKDARFLVNKALEHYSMSFHEDVDELIEEGHAVEFYSLNHMQIFRTFNCFEYTSYTIEDMYCRPWYSLYEREDKIAEQLMVLAAPVLRGEYDGIMRLEVPPHFITERASLERLQMLCESVWVAPLHDEKAQTGYICIQQVKSTLQN